MTTPDHLPDYDHLFADFFAEIGQVASRAQKSPTKVARPEQQLHLNFDSDRRAANRQASSSPLWTSEDQRQLFL